MLNVRFLVFKAVFFKLWIVNPLRSTSRFPGEWWAVFSEPMDFFFPPGVFRISQRCMLPVLRTQSTCSKKRLLRNGLCRSSHFLQWSWISKFLFRYMVKIKASLSIIRECFIKGTVANTLRKIPNSVEFFALVKREPQQWKPPCGDPLVNRAEKY